MLAGAMQSIENEPPRGNIVATYDYIDDEDERLYQVDAQALDGVAETIRIVRLPGLPDKGDVSDWLDADPRNAQKFGDICFDAPLWTPETTAPPPQGASAPEVKLSFFDQLTDAMPKPWLIKNVIARGETLSWIAQPGKGKSALLTDIAIHVAAVVLTGFKLEPFDLGVDEDGDPFRTYILTEEILDGIQVERPLSDQQRLAIEALCEDPVVPAKLATGQRSATRHQNRHRRSMEGRALSPQRPPRARFAELRTRLMAKKLIGTQDELVWLARHS